MCNNYLLKQFSTNFHTDIKLCLVLDIILVFVYQKQMILL